MGLRFKSIIINNILQQLEVPGSKKLVKFSHKKCYKFIFFLEGFQGAPHRNQESTVRVRVGNVGFPPFAARRVFFFKSHVQFLTPTCFQRFLIMPNASPPPTLEWAEPHHPCPWMPSCSVWAAKASGTHSPRVPSPISRGAQPRMVQCFAVRFFFF